MPRAVISRPAKTAMQSGKAKAGQWLLEYETETPREPDPLMGWASAADTLNEVHLRFETLEEAVGFAQKHGIEYSVVKPAEPRLRPKSYSDNFRWQRPS
jgi:hypothetical protein